ncbi:MAG: peptidase T, partial [Muribaculaceae bacterium]|nr:peptidase T [Muribaculaceae bacterium]
MEVLSRFLDYVKFDTQSDELTNMTPSTPGQLHFAEYLKERVAELGLTEITLDENGYLMATLESNVSDRNVPTIGFIAHLDTSPDMSGRHVNPRIVKSYDGTPITLNAEQNIILSPEEFPELLH